MTNIKAITPLERYFNASKKIKRVTARKVVEGLRARNISYDRKVENDVITISYSSKKGDKHYTYAFSNDDAKILSKERKTADTFYRTEWTDDSVRFKMFSNDGSNHVNIKKDVKVERQSLWQRLRSKEKLHDLVHIRLVKDVLPQTSKNRSMTKNIYITQGGVTITDIKSQIAYRVQSKAKQGFRLNVSSQVPDMEIQNQVAAFRRIN